jgi:hypothetical protein
MKQWIETGYEPVTSVNPPFYDPIPEPSRPSSHSVFVTPAKQVLPLPVPLPGIMARENAEIGAGIRHLKAASACQWLRPTTFAYSKAKPCFRRVRCSIAICTLVTLGP